MRVLVIDDEPLARSGVVVQLSTFDDVEVLGECGDGLSAIAGIREHRPDVVVLDVQMPGMDGIDVLRSLPLDERPLAILLTAHESFAVSAFELDAIDYLLKPLDDERFAEAIARVRRRLGKSSLPTDHTPSQSGQEPQRFEVRVGRRTVFVPVGDVEYLQADGDYVALHVDGKRHLIRESLQRLQERLDGDRFLRIHRSVIVRIDRVAEMQALSNRDALLRLHDGTLLRASRTYVDALRARLRLFGN
ncbi:MAG: response regulator transcription factor [Proteobacteria bacterium]|nr:response regulator transcription factor [Pseudomonadota bacterium]